MSMQRRKFSKEFKIQIIREIDNGTPVAQLSRQHQIQESLIHKWRKQFQKDPVHAFSGNGIPSTQEAKMAQLERTILRGYPREWCILSSKMAVSGSKWHH
jgi:transposase